MYWDHEIAETIRATAITDINDIKVGGIYYSNWQGKFQVKKLTTLREIYTRDGLSGCHGSNLNNIYLIVTLMNDDEYEYGSLVCDMDMSAADNNIGSSYNPWFIFDSQEKLDHCKKVLDVTFRYDDDYSNAYDY